MIAPPTLVKKERLLDRCQCESTCRLSGQLCIFCMLEKVLFFKASVQGIEIARWRTCFDC